MRYTVKSRRERNVKDAKVDFDVRGNDARIEFHSPTSGNTQFDVELEVPPNTNLDVHEKVGDMTVENVEGDKDLSLSVGDIRVDAGHSGYRLVHASTSIGDVNGNGYGETSGWLGKTLKYHGDGKYELRAHVGGGYYAGRKVGSGKRRLHGLGAKSGESVEGADGGVKTRRQASAVLLQRTSFSTSSE